MHCPHGNATDPIWRVLASSQGIFSWTPLKTQHSNPNPNPSPLANQLWCIDLLTPPAPLIIPHRLPVFLESLMPHTNWCSIHARWSKSSLKHSIRFCSIFPILKQDFMAYRSSKVSARLDWIFEIYQLWQSGFSWVYSICCCSCWFEAEIIKIDQSSHKMYSNNIVNFQESTTTLNAHRKKAWKLIECTTYIVASNFGSPSLLSIFLKSIKNYFITAAPSNSRSWCSYRLSLLLDLKNQSEILLKSVHACLPINLTILNPKSVNKKI